MISLRILVEQKNSAWKVRFFRSNTFLYWWFAMLLIYSKFVGLESFVDRSVTSYQLENRKNDNVPKRIHEHTISLRFLGIILRVLMQTWGFRIQCLHYKPVLNHFFSGGGGGGGFSPLVEVTVNSKEENSWDFRPYYVLEFSLCTEEYPRSQHLPEIKQIPLLYHLICWY